MAAQYMLEFMNLRIVLFPFYFDVLTNSYINSKENCKIGSIYGGCYQCIYNMNQLFVFLIFILSLIWHNYKL